MGEAGRIEDQLQRSYDGDAWHGPPLTELLDGVTAEQASRRPIAGAHTIWEIVVHVAVWQRVARRRLDGERARQLAPTEDWPAVAESSSSAWEEVLRGLARDHLDLCTAIRALGDGRLGEQVAGAEYSYYHLLHGIAQHNLYHAGQIALLKKALAAPEDA